MEQISLRLMVPSSNLKDTNELMSIGADDIYVGAVANDYFNYSFNGRAVFAKNGKKVLPNFKEIELMCLATHSNGGFVYFLANTPMINGACGDLKNKYLDYVGEGIHAGVDYIVVGSINALLWIKEKFPKANVVASSYLEAQNEYTIRLLEDIGVNQIVLSYQCTLDEIRQLCSISNAKIEVFGHGGCSFFVGSCNMFHEMGEKVNIGYPCRGIYEVTNGVQKSKMRILDGFKMCSLCALGELSKCGVHSIKIVGRDLPAEYILTITKVYAEAIKQIKMQHDLKFEELDLPKWWKRAWCYSDKDLCRYGGSKSAYNRS